MTKLLNDCNTSLTPEMSLSWPPRYTSIHELSKIINSPNILRLPFVVLASLQQLNSCSCNQDLHCNSMHSHWQYRLKIRCALYLAFEWRVQPNIWVYMKWLVGKQARFWLQFGGRAVTLFCRYFPAGHRSQVIPRALAWPVALKIRVIW